MREGVIGERVMGEGVMGGRLINRGVERKAKPPFLDTFTGKTEIK